VQRARHQLLAHPGLALNEHREVGRRHLPDPAHHALHAHAAAQQGAQRAAPAHLAAQALDLLQQLGPLQRPLHDDRQLVGVYRLGEKLVRAQLDGLHGHAHVGEAGEHHHRQLRVDDLDPLQHLQPADARQPQVQHHDVGRVGGHLLQGGRPVVHHRHAQAGRITEQRRQDASLHGVVVDRQQPSARLGRDRGRQGRQCCASFALIRRQMCGLACHAASNPRRSIRRYTMDLRQAR
jgi:hypothetical protein